MKYEHNFYITKDKLLDIEFLFIDLGAEIRWRGYVLSEINYKQFSAERSDVYTDTHLYIDENQHRYIDADKDYPYICWTKPIFDLDTMHELATMWAEITSYYIWTGMDLHKRARCGIICISEVKKGYHNGKSEVQRGNEAANRQVCA